MDLTNAAVQRGLRGWFRSRQDGSLVWAVSLLASGFEADIFAFLRSTGREGMEEPEDLVLRLYAGDGASEKAAREFDAMSRLRQAGYPVPRVLFLERDGSAVGRPFVIMERIDGVPLESTYWSAPEDCRHKYQALHYRLMARLHALPGSAILPDSPLASAQPPYPFLEQELSFLSEMLDRLEGSEPTSLREALAWLESRRILAPCERLTVVHGDFHRNNVLVRADGVPFVIDWSNVRLADYRMDLAWTRLIAHIAERREGGQVELQLYEQLAGKPITLLAYFEAVACLRLLSSILVSLRFGSARQGMRPEAEEVMRRDANTTRYVAALLGQRTGLKTTDFDDALTALLG